MRYVSYRAEQVVRRTALQMKSIQSNAWRNLFGLWDGEKKRSLFSTSLSHIQTGPGCIIYPVRQSKADASATVVSSCCL